MKLKYGILILAIIICITGGVYASNVTSDNPINTVLSAVLGSSTDNSPVQNDSVPDASVTDNQSTVPDSSVSDNSATISDNNANKPELVYSGNAGFVIPENQSVNSHHGDGINTVQVKNSDDSDNYVGPSKPTNDGNSGSTVLVSQN